MKQTTSIRLSQVEKQSVDEALKYLGMSMAEYFVRLHYAFWEIGKKMTKEKMPESISKEQQLIKKLKDMGVIENAGNAGTG